MKTVRTLLAALACALPLLAAAQWQWVGPDGRKVFSDQPPPPGIPEKNILKRPSGAPAPVAAAPAAAAAPASTASAAKPALTGKDKELEDKKKAADAAEKDKRQAEAERNAKGRAESCDRAKKAKASFESGQRISRTNDKGEREYIDDAARAAEIKRLQGVIDTDCKV